MPSEVTPLSHEMTLCLLTAVGGLASHASAHGIFAAWADAKIIEVISAHLRVLPRSLWGDRETGVSAWRRCGGFPLVSSDDDACDRLM